MESPRRLVFITSNKVDCSEPVNLSRHRQKTENFGFLNLELDFCQAQVLILGPKHF